MHAWRYTELQGKRPRAPTVSFLFGWEIFYFVLQIKVCYTGEFRVHMNFLDKRGFLKNGFLVPEDWVYIYSFLLISLLHFTGEGTSSRKSHRVGKTKGLLSLPIFFPVYSHFPKLSLPREPVLWSAYSLISCLPLKLPILKDVTKLRLLDKLFSCTWVNRTAVFRPPQANQAAILSSSDFGKERLFWEKWTHLGNKMLAIILF